MKLSLLVEYVIAGLRLLRHGERKAGATGTIITD